MADDKKDAPARKRQPRKGQATPGPAIRALRPELSDPPVTEMSDTVVYVGDMDEALEAIDQKDFAKWEAELGRLREPFPPERIEKLPKPLYKGAWDGERKGHCSECGGYHVIANTIHLDYVGHANCTDRLLSVDPTWDWEPMAYTEAGTPLFTDGGLWIRLTVCGVTRIGFGDGATVKETIGDAIRNAAMRFGVALDLWAKINLHEERNPGDGPTQSQGRRTDSGGSARPARQGEQQSEQAVHQAPRPNKDALDSLASVCDEHGYDRRTMRDRYAAWVGEQSVADTKVKVTDLLDAPSEYIIAFAAYLIEALDPPDGDGVDGGGDTGAVDGQPQAGSDGAVRGAAEAVPADEPEGQEPGDSGAAQEPGDGDRQVPADDGDGTGEPAAAEGVRGDAATSGGDAAVSDARGDDEAQSMF